MSTKQDHWLSRAATHALGDPTVVRAFLAAIDNYMASEYGGETVHYYAARVTVDAREQRDARIAAALQAGLATEVIAKTERITERHVRRLRGRLRGHIGP